MKLAGVVVLFNPEESTMVNILTYAKSLSYLYVFDNSSTDNKNLVNQKLAGIKFKYISDQTNHGLGYALKVSAELAIKEGYTHLLTMDQDSSFNNFHLYLLDVNECPFSNVAIYGVRDENHIRKERYSVVKETITSGNIIDLKSYKLINGFNENLFIDHIDFDICYQFYKIKKKIVVCNNIKTNHEIGNPVTKSIFGMKITLMNHSPLRDYYMYRNGTYCFYKAFREGHPFFFFKHYIGYRTKTYFGIRFLEDNSKEKVRMLKLGIKHGIQGKLGQFEVKSVE